jgi:hypothetical protein
MQVCNGDVAPDRAQPDLKGRAREDARRKELPGKVTRGQLRVQLLPRRGPQPGRHTLP